MENINRTKYLTSGILKFSLSILFFSLIYYLSSINADGYYYLDNGKRILEDFSIPNLDAFSFNTGFIFMRIIEWFPDILFYFFYSTFGENLLLLIIPSIFVFIFYWFWIIRDEKFSYTSLSIYLGIVIPLYASLFVIRAELLMCLYYLYFFYFLIYRSPSKKAVFVACIVQILWVNSHPSFILPIIFSLICSLAQTVEYLFKRENESVSLAKRYSQLALLLTAFSLFNPYLHLSFEDFFYRVSSYAYRSVDITQGIKFFESPAPVLIFLSLFVLAFLKNSKVFHFRLNLLLSVQFFMTLFGVRYLIILLISSLPLFLLLIEDIVNFIKTRVKLNLLNKSSRAHVRDSFGEISSRTEAAMGVVPCGFAAGGGRYDPPKNLSLLKILLSITCLLAGLFFLIRPRLHENLYFHVNRSISYLQKQEGKNLLAPYEYGTYLTHKLYPKYKVFLDGRSYLYDPNLVYFDYKKIAYGNNSQRNELLKCYPVDYILWPKNKPSLLKYLEENRTFKEVYSDPYFFIYQKRLR